MREAEQVLEADPNAFRILFKAACRASWKENRTTGLGVGQAFVGYTDFPSMGRQQYRGACKRILTCGFATIRTTTKGSIISLQGHGFADFTPYGTTIKTTNEQPSSNHQATTNEDGKTIRRKIKDYTEIFEDFWNAYPKARRQAKKKTYQSWQRIDCEIHQTIVNHVKERVRHDMQWAKDNGQFAPMATTFLNQQRWEDEYEGIRRAKPVNKNRPAQVMYKPDGTKIIRKSDGRAVDIKSLLNEL